MERIAISKFKATCSSLLDRVKETGQPFLVTRRGEPIAQVVPPPASRDTPTVSAFGSMAGSMKILGDIVEPLGEDDWEVLK